MREVRIKVAQGYAADVVRLAHELSIEQVSVGSEWLNDPAHRREVVSMEISTPEAKSLVDALLAADFYTKAQCSMTTRAVRSIIGSQRLATLTVPWPEPTSDVLQDLWQFNHVTVGLSGRVLIGALLLGYGMIENHVLMLASGLLFMPLLPVMLAIGMALERRDGPLLLHGAKALSASTLFMLLGGAIASLLTRRPVQFTEFSDPLTACLLSVGIGIAGALATGDDVGRRELIGLATASQVAVVPVFVGTAFARLDLTHVAARCASFASSLLSLLASSALTYAWLRLRHHRRRSSSSESASSGVD